MTDFVVVHTTTETKEQAAEIAQALVEARLAACVQIAGPIESCYRWEGQVTTSGEWLVTAKARRERFDDVAAAIRRVHPYEVPEIIATPVVAASEAYRAWAEEQTRQEPS